ncbi:VOC family protein [Glycomyces sp. NPDC046736]|uniref:VOC family protein n=1 Tax=Glycomyces sp. NPDC046736 TaxID=3155615 RepID=UPI003407B69E
MPPRQPARPAPRSTKAPSKGAAKGAAARGGAKGGAKGAAGGARKAQPAKAMPRGARQPVGRGATSEQLRQQRLTMDQQRREREARWWAINQHAMKDLHSRQHHAAGGEAIGTVLNADRRMRWRTSRAVGAITLLILAFFFTSMAIGAQSIGIAVLAFACLAGCIAFFTVEHSARRFPQPVPAPPLIGQHRLEDLIVEDDPRPAPPKDPAPTTIDALDDMFEAPPRPEPKPAAATVAQPEAKATPVERPEAQTETRAASVAQPEAKAAPVDTTRVEVIDMPLDEPVATAAEPEPAPSASRGERFDMPFTTGPVEPDLSEGVRTAATRTGPELSASEPVEEAASVEPLDSPGNQPAASTAGPGAMSPVDLPPDEPAVTTAEAAAVSEPDAVSVEPLDLPGNQPAASAAGPGAVAPVDLPLDEPSVASAVAVEPLDSPGNQPAASASRPATTTPVDLPLDEPPATAEATAASEAASIEPLDLPSNQPAASAAEADGLLDLPLDSPASEIAGPVNGHEPHSKPGVKSPGLSFSMPSDRIGGSIGTPVPPLDPDQVPPKAPAAEARAEPPRQRDSAEGRNPAQDLARMLLSEEALEGTDVTDTAATLIVADLQRSVEFYTDALGLHILDRTDEAAVLEAGFGRILLWERPDAPTGETGIMHLTFEVGDIDTTFAEMNQAGVQFLHLPRTALLGQNYQMRAASFRDPDGHGLAITEHRERD